MTGWRTMLSRVRGPPGSASTHVQLPEAGVGWGGVTYTVVLDILLRCYTMSLAFWQEWFLWDTQDSTPRQHWSSELQSAGAGMGKAVLWGILCVWESVFILIWDRGLRAYYVWLYAFNFYSLEYSWDWTSSFISHLYIFFKSCLLLLFAGF